MAASWRRLARSTLPLLLLVALGHWGPATARADCGNHIPVLVTWGGIPVGSVGITLLYGSESNPQSTTAPFLVTDTSGQALFACIPPSPGYLLRISWGEEGQVRSALTGVFAVQPDNGLIASGSRMLVETMGSGPRLRVDLAWLRPPSPTNAPRGAARSPLLAEGLTVDAAVGAPPEGQALPLEGTPRAAAREAEEPAGGPLSPAQVAAGGTSGEEAAPARALSAGGAPGTVERPPEPRAERPPAAAPRPLASRLLTAIAWLALAAVSAGWLSVAPLPSLRSSPELPA